MNSLIPFILGAVTLTTSLVPNDITEFLITSDVPATVTFRSDAAITAPVTFNLYDTRGTRISELTGTPHDNNFITVSLTLAPGFYELEPASTETRYGIISQPWYIGDQTQNVKTDSVVIPSSPLPDSLTNVKKESPDHRGSQNKTGTRDPFFCLDGALSWLVPEPAIQEKLIVNARRIGVCQIRDRIGWESFEPEPGRFLLDDNPGDTLRKWCLENEIGVLDLFHITPSWGKKVERYPEDLIKLADTGRNFYQHWNRYWSSFEVWNEPDIFFGGDLPADQYVPLLKTLNYEIGQMSRTFPIVGGVIALYQPQWMKTAARSGILDRCDVFSFHTYCFASDMETICRKFQSWLTQNGHPNKPVWVTECGRPWPGQNRPAPEADLTSAVDVIMKGIETRCCGFNAYFPYIYPFENNFSLTDSNYVPLRPLAAYAQMIRLLSHAEPIGDLPNLPANTERGRIFLTQDQKKLLVLYASSPKAGRTVTLPFIPSGIEGITGEILTVESDGQFSTTVDFSDGFLYVHVPDEIPLHPEKESTVWQIRKARMSSPSGNVGVDKTSPVVLRYDFDKSQVAPFSGGYRITNPGLESITISLTAFNLSQREITTPVIWNTKRPDSVLDCPQTLTIPAQGRIGFTVTLSTREITDLTPFTFQFDQPDRLFLRFTREIPADELNELKAEKLALPISENKHWQKTESGEETLLFFTNDEKSPDCQWGFHTEFTNGDHRAYPMFSITPELFSPGRASDYAGILLRVRGTTPGGNGQIGFLTWRDTGIPYYHSPAGIARPDGQWHLLYIPFDQLSPVDNMPNTFDANQITALSVGGDTPDNSMTVEIGDFYLVRPSDPDVENE